MTGVRITVNLAALGGVYGKHNAYLARRNGTGAAGR
jgi:hypothetical protein